LYHTDQKFLTKENKIPKCNSRLKALHLQWKLEEWQETASWDATRCSLLEINQLLDEKASSILRAEEEETRCIIQAGTYTKIYEPSAGRFSYVYSPCNFRYLCGPLSVLHLTPFPRKPPSVLEYTKCLQSRVCNGTLAFMFVANYLVVFNVTNINNHLSCTVFVFHCWSCLTTHSKSHVSIITPILTLFDNRRNVVLFPKVVRDSFLLQTDQIGSEIHRDSSWTGNRGV
jgi:hypothetical protein